jgi:hypothetical protein
MKALIILATLLAAPAFADAYLKIDDIKGEAESVKDEADDAKETDAPATADRHRPDSSVVDWSKKSGAGDYNSSRSNRTVGRRLDDDSDGDGLGVSDVARACNAKDDDCNDQVRDAASGLPTGRRQHGAVEEDENSTRRENREDRKTTRD